MFLDIIFSFEDKPQQWLKYPCHPSLLRDKKIFFEYATSLITDEEKKKLVKISCCIYEAKGFKVPKTHWYNKCHGKFYDLHINPLMKEIWNIETTFTPINY